MGNVPSSIGEGSFNCLAMENVSLTLAMRNIWLSYSVEYNIPHHKMGLIQDFFAEGGNYHARHHTQTRGVWGHAPPEIFLKFMTSETVSGGI
jgi:hypothetical protein